MKTLKESLLGNIEDSLSISVNDICALQIDEFIKENYSISTKYTISKKPNKDGLFVLNSRSDVSLINKQATSLTNNMFTWGKCKSFNCRGTNIKNLKGAPEKTGVFNCSYCNNLETLEGCPKEASYIVLSESKIKNLIGLHEFYDGNLLLNNCTALESLEGCPKRLKSLHLNECFNLKSLKYGPNIVDETVDCCKCTSLESLEGAPKEIGGNFLCHGCTGLKTFTGAPKYVGGSFNALNCPNVESLDVPYMTVGRIFCCEGALKLKSFKGAPKKVADAFIADNCPNVHSFVGIPNNISRLYVEGKYFDSLNGFPTKLDYLVMGHYNKFTADDITKVCNIDIQNIKLD